MSGEIDHQKRAWQLHTDWMIGRRREVFRELCRLNRWDFALVVSLARPLFERELPGFWMTFEDEIIARSDRHREREDAPREDTP